MEQPDVERGAHLVTLHAECLAELAARGDAELAVGVPQVVLHGGESDDELRRDLAVPTARGRKLGDAPLTACQRSRAGDQRPTRSGSGRAQLGERVLLQSGRAASVGEIDGIAKRLARIEWPAGAPQRHAELKQRSRAPDRVRALLRHAY